MTLEEAVRAVTEQNRTFLAQMRAIPEGGAWSRMQKTFAEAQRASELLSQSQGLVKAIEALKVRSPELLRAQEQLTELGNSLSLARADYTSQLSGAAKDWNNMVLSLPPRIPQGVAVRSEPKELIAPTPDQSDELAAAKERIVELEAANRNLKWALAQGPEHDPPPPDYYSPN